MSCRSAGDEPVVESARPVRAPHVIDEAHARHELHREEAALVLDEELIEAHQVRVRHVGEASELPFQPIEVGRTGPQKRLQCDDLVANSVVHFIDGPHAACAQPAHHAKAPGAGKLLLGLDRRSQQLAADGRETSACPRGPAGAA